MSTISVEQVYQRLCLCEKENNWETLPQFLQPKYFQKAENVTEKDTKLLAKLAQILTNSTLEIPGNVKIILLKCLVNSCIHAYKYKPYFVKNEEISKYETEIYDLLSENSVEISNLKIDETYPKKTHFPYDGVSFWCFDTVLELTNKSEKLSNEELDILTQSIQFLSNFVSFGCKTTSAPELEKAPPHLEKEEFKTAILILTGNEHIPISRAACVFLYNTVTQSEKNYITQELLLMKNLIKSSKLGVNVALDLALVLIQERNILPKIYDSFSIDESLYILEIIHHQLLNETDCNFPDETVIFLGEKFKRKSDLILKTVDTYLDGMEPLEVTRILDILGIFTSKSDSTSDLLRRDKSLLINAIYLLKSVHMVGKEANNYFTPLQKLSDVAPNCREKANPENEISKDFEAHPAYGFKAGLVRLIGNLVFENKPNQDLVREEEGIPVLLDCCNIDARNPLIIQWVILTMKNLCYKNFDNQKIIQECTKIGVIDSAALKEMGLTLHEEDGKSIGIMPVL